MTDLQKQSIEKLAEKNIAASFNGDFLNCKRAMKSGKKQSGKNLVLFLTTLLALTAID